MSDESSKSIELERVFEKYAALHLQQSAAMNKRVDALVDNMASMAEKMGLFMEVMAKSEEKHNSQSEKSDRIEKNQIDQGKDLKAYKQDNDNRVVVIEKQILLLDISDKTSKGRWAAVDKWKATVLASITIGFVLVYMGLK